MRDHVLTIHSLINSSAQLRHDEALVGELNALRYRIFLPQRYVYPHKATPTLGHLVNGRKILGI
jgi:hypothetical protein